MDNLTACLLIVVTTIGMLVHLYSIGYMAHDPGRWRFFAYLNLFMFSMLLLVLARHFLIVFAAWELVGLSQLPAHRLLVPQALGRPGRQEGLHRQPRRRRRLRARDHGHLGHHRHAQHPRRRSTADRRGLRPARTDRRRSRCCVFCGAVGKSAQFPLHVWLPDAMEGPTPVSRPHPCRDDGQRRRLPGRPGQPDLRQAPEAMVVVAAIGIFTAILAAIDRLHPDGHQARPGLLHAVASSGYMFAALGVGAYVAAIFHLMAHGFFKGLLFLGSGSVIHAVHEEQDMNRMGGLWRKIPITHATMLIGTHRHRRHPAAAGLLQQGRDPRRELQVRASTGSGRSASSSPA